MHLHLGGYFLIKAVREVRMARKRSKLGRWISKIRVGTATVVVHGKTKKAAKANAQSVRGKQLKMSKWDFSRRRFRPSRAIKPDYCRESRGRRRSRRGKNKLEKLEAEINILVDRSCSASLNG